MQYTTDDGAIISGRAAVADGLAKYFSKNHGATLQLAAESARFLTPEVLVEKGVSTVASGARNRESTRYTVTYVNRENAWLIAEIEEAALPPVEPQPLRRSGELEWMVGSWKDNSPGITVETHAAWTKKGSLSPSVFLRDARRARTPSKEPR